MEEEIEVWAWADSVVCESLELVGWENKDESKVIFGQAFSTCLSSS